MKLPKQVVTNPTGKGGFADNPHNRSSGHWDKEKSYSYQLNAMRWMTEDELNKIAKDKKKPIVMRQAAQTHIESMTELRSRDHMANRTDGKPIETVRTQEINDEPIQIIRRK